MTYTLIFSTITGKSSVHADGCPCATKRSGMVVERIPGGTAKEVLHSDAVLDLSDRGYPRTTVSPCAR